MYILNVIKKYILVVLLAVGLLLPNSAFSADSTLAQSTQTWRCMSGGAASYALTWHNPPSASTISQSISGTGFATGDKVYVVGCQPGQAGTACTTGNASTDTTLFGQDNTTLVPVTFAGQNPQTASYGKVEITVTISGTTANSGSYTFYGVTIKDNEPVGAGDTNTLEQQSVVNFEGDSSNCTGISWTHYDPYGIVFDSKSLEPIPNVQVTILDKNKQKLSLIGLTNPQKTKEDGLFNFMVEPGEYYLSVLVPSGYSFTANPTLNKNANVIYHKDNGGNSIYKPDEKIVEVIDTAEEQKQGYPNAERRDIPLDPSLTPLKTQPKLMTYSVRNLGSKTVFEGKVSHPFTKVIITQGTAQLASANADRIGVYRVEVNNNKINQTEKLNVKLEKVDLTGKLSTSKLNLDKIINRFGKQLSHIFNFVVNAQENVLSIDPIFTKVEGYAYDANGKIIPNATVRIMPKLSKKPFYQTKADASGFFSIDKSKLPMFTYTIEIVSSSGQKISMSTTDFAKKNKDYLTKNNVSLVNNPVVTKIGSKDSDKISTVGGKGLPSVTTNNDSNKASGEVQNAVESKKSMVVIYFVVVLVVLLGLIGTAVWFYLKKKNQPLSPESLS